MNKFVLAISAVLLATSLTAQEQKKAWNFDLDPAGALSKGFTVCPGTGGQKLRIYL